MASTEWTQAVEAIYFVRFTKAHKVKHGPANFKDDVNIQEDRFNSQDFRAAQIAQNGAGCVPSLASPARAGVRARWH